MVTLGQEGAEFDCRGFEKQCFLLEVINRGPLRERLLDLRKQDKLLIDLCFLVNNFPPDLESVRVLLVHLVFQDTVNAFPQVLDFSPGLWSLRILSLVILSLLAMPASLVLLLILRDHLVRHIHDIFKLWALQDGLLPHHRGFANPLNLFLPLSKNVLRANSLLLDSVRLCRLLLLRTLPPHADLM